ncbi:acetate--CoA ligase family protein [Paludibaculum fermentans]|uniref:Acetate--CoA ligase family protein n=1 Tax=Paludibaculum fermentans TaxID=1473598 RepID=A0A7S7NMM1_PALFE|nr:acetate--CoA ligase family protein [Paludibaculum fermentans]QOY86418.1 acetate--CoA ligase family protein [Paludibaculum fermentans]
MVLADETLRLQAECGAHVSRAWCVEGAEPGTHVAVVEMEDEEVARRCFSAVLAACPVPAERVQQLREWADDIVLGPNTRALAEAARRRCIPVRRMGQGSLLILGYGIRQRRLWGARSDRTSAIAEMIGWDKPLAKELLRGAGIPVPDGRLAVDAADAVKAAAEIGGPVVIKPESANHGRSVFLNLSDPAGIAAAFQAAQGEGESGAVLVERCVMGAEHRVLVVGGRVIAALRGDPLYAAGDGRRSLRALVEEINLDPARGAGPECPLYPVEFDEVTSATLRRQGFTAETILAPGERALIQRNGNLRLDVTGNVHPANAALCVLAAETVGLDIAGIDLVAEDIAVPLPEQAGALLEVNPMPGFAMHAGIPVADLIVREVYPEGADGRIPIVAVHGSSAAGVVRVIHGPLLDRGMVAGALLLNPRLEVGVFELPEQAIVERGLEFDRCDVLVLTDSPALEPGARLLIGCVASDGVVLVPDSAPWREEVGVLCRGSVRAYETGPGCEAAVACLVDQELSRRCR